MGADASELLDPLPAVLLRHDAAEGGSRALVAAHRLQRSGDGVEIEAVPTGKIFMTRGWGEIARVCRARGALAIHFEYDGASMLFFKVFDAEGPCLECCSGEERQADPRSARGHSSSSSSPWESSSSPEPYETSETSDESYVPPSSRRARSRAAASGRRCR